MSPRMLIQQVKRSVRKGLGRIVRKAAATFGYELTRRPLRLLTAEAAQAGNAFPPLDLSAVISIVLEGMDTRSMRFVQVGANDGKTNDFLFEVVQRYTLAGLLIEPQPELLEALRANYAGCPNVTIANLAIDAVRGRRELFRVRPEFQAAYRAACGQNPTGFASFDRAHVVKHVQQNLRQLLARLKLSPEACVEAIVVPCAPLGEYLLEAGIMDPQLVVIDAEGHDACILRTLDLTQMRPRILVYEHKHLDRAERQAIAAHLAAFGYRQFVAQGNTLALQAYTAAPAGYRSMASGACDG